MAYAMRAVNVISSDSARTDNAGQTMVAVGGMQNMAWASDTSKFGFKMLVKMGWSAGKGVGKHLQGQATHVKVARRSENLGVGCSLKQAEVQGWAETAGGFADVLNALNNSYSCKTCPEVDRLDESDSSDTCFGKKRQKSEKKKAKKAKKVKSEDESKTSKKSKKSKKRKKVGIEKTTISRRLHYRRRQTNKDAKSYSAEEMAAILGVASSAYKPAVG
ncbi:pin2 terf1-interacting telomerase inhibitor 1 [Plasmopara halstedii]|uniref:PinX1-related protein 1 n=1 Tax=Plasmopara halstedii TaxID=4781 RepID=A0A0P1AVK5_PLAHL|nr:pin2 terf1-interacting telomerase inhibitor 1 [Plasmopara halstedii]CEG45792.1 pin2 terf1-interacting telomerase inhibitor 1 [Plasmopara halstedii]|eukprot:XP_024582161.1 pin2 terf1-interacting telomerase inhibitor 1 [Plasmopara halstedii]